MRKMIRPRGKLATRLELQTPQALNKVVTDLNTGELSAAPPRELPNVPTVHDVADAAKPGNIPDFFIGMVRKNIYG